MSLLGFDALGRLALGQLPKSSLIVLPAAAGSFALTGNAVTFKVTEAIAVGSFALSGVSTSFNITENVGAGSFAFTGIAASLRPTVVAVTGAFVLTGFAVYEPITENISPGAFVLTGINTPLRRSGADFDLTYGGIGHYLYEQERARQLAKITRKAPAPVDRRTAPTFKTIGSPPAAPVAPVIDLQATQNQRMAAQMQALAQAKTKRRREEEAILLLAS